MAMSRKDERSLLNHEEITLVDSTHHPEIAALSRDELEAARKRLRDIRNRERDLSHHKTRIARGKADPRGGSFPGTAELPRRRKQVFAHALRRVNSEMERVKGRESRARMVESQHRALAMKRGGSSHRPANTATASSGPASIENAKRATKVSGAKVGKVSQHTKNRQAQKDG